GSNEEMASLLKAKNAVYDLVFPSDYMIDKFVEDDLIQTIDFSLLPNHETLSLNQTLAGLYEGYGISDYVVPYAWGTIGIMYRTDKPGLKELLEAKEWAVLFEYGDTYRTGMYDSPRDAVAAALLYLGYSVNSENEDELAEAEAALKNAGFYAWGEDNLKGRVIANTLDLALVYSGDYFSEYYSAVEDERVINFGFYVPNATNVWMDGMVIPKIARNVPLAHKFIDFLLREDVALANYQYIGYAPPYDLIYDEIYAEIETDFGGLAANFDPYPEGSIREMYVYGSNERSKSIVDILQRAKASS
ncbi:MAG: extracellular solute-binding protein, partial [Acholeplasmataceae bacterium]|nr:extracellular solute-binding protein [Acholeplasmataceae bacterium]